MYAISTNAEAPSVHSELVYFVARKDDGVAVQYMYSETPLRKHLFKTTVSAAYGLAHAESEYLTNVAYPVNFDVEIGDAIGNATGNAIGDLIGDETDDVAGALVGDIVRAVVG